MLEFLFRRSLRAVIVLAGISVVVFAAVRAIPGDPALLLAGDQATGEMVAQLRIHLGLTQPVWVQYGVFVEHALSGDLGRSTWTGQPVVVEIRRRYMLTLALACAAITFSLAAGIPLGIMAALRHATWVDKLSVGIALLGVSAQRSWWGSSCNSTLPSS
jgi:peptide/nickel transport system permease protein